MIKKTFVLIPVVMLFTACSQNSVVLNDQSPNDSTKETKLSYSEYKKLYDAKNSSVKNKPLNNYEAILTPKEYKNLMLDDKSDEKVDSVQPTSTKKRSFMDFYSEWKNVKYKMGGESKRGIDCSAFAREIYKEKYNTQLPRSTLTQVNMGKEVKKSDLKPGDLVFFKTGKRTKHVGVYVGDNNFLHASVKGIQFTSLDKPFYKKSYWTSRRVIN